ncbi:MAG: hypothetical protein IPN89_07810 [Saprospiraceae bacterium]|nr:hypothetical protein [Saprospiraceae bacterium]
MDTNIAFFVFCDNFFSVCTYVYGKAMRTLRHRQEPMPSRDSKGTSYKLAPAGEHTWQDGRCDRLGTVDVYHVWFVFKF